MTGRRHRVTASTGNITIRSVRAGKRPLTATSLSAMQHNSSDSVHLRNDVEAQLQAVKNYMDHEHATIVKQIEAQSAKLKKRWKQERQSCSTSAEAADNDWRNFLADNEEDTRENKNSIEILLSKLDVSTTHFTKTYIPELLKSVEMSVDAMKNRYVKSGKTARTLSARGKINPKLTGSKGK